MMNTLSIDIAKSRLVWLFLLFVVTIILPVPANAASSRVHQKTPTSRRKINALIARMTLAEKLGQLQQLDGEANGKYRPEHFEMARKGLLGSTLNVRGVKETNELQRAASGIASEDSDPARVRCDPRLPDDLSCPAWRNGKLGPCVDREEFRDRRR